MLARCMMIVSNRHPVKIKAEDYQEFLTLSYEEFKEATNIWGAVGMNSYSYNYCITEENDTKEARLQYIDYLVNRKGFNV